MTLIGHLQNAGDVMHEHDACLKQSLTRQRFEILSTALKSVLLLASETVDQFIPSEPLSNEELAEVAFSPSAKSDKGLAGLTGNSQELGIAELLSLLASLRKTGLLFVYSEKEDFVVQLDEGWVSFVRGFNPPQSQRLGNLLVERELISNDEIDALLGQADEGAVLGDLLRESATISEDRLRETLIEQARHVFTRLCRTNFATFQFLDGTVHWGGYDLRQSVTGLLLEGSRRVDESTEPERAEPAAKERAEPAAKERAEPAAKERAEPAAKERAEPAAKERAKPAAKPAPASLVKQASSATNNTRKPSKSKVGENPQRRILLIRDDKAKDESLSEMLESDARVDALEEVAALLPGAETTVKYAVDTIDASPKGLERLKCALDDDGPYALAIIDMRTPSGADGIETIERIWNIDHDIQILACTAKSDDTGTEMIKRLGYSDRLLVLKQPFESNDLHQLAFALTEKWQMAQAARLQTHALLNKPR